jgi:hypothetical protein
VSSARSALLLVLLCAPGNLASQTRSHSLELGLSLDRLDHRDDHASRLRYSGYLRGLRFGYRTETPASRFFTGFDLRDGSLSADLGGEQQTAEGSYSATYDRRVRTGISVGASVALSGRLLEHRYAIGLTETFVGGDLALRPVVRFTPAWLGRTETRVAATAAAMVFRPYSRAKAGNYGSPKFASPSTWRDVSIAIERPLGATGRFVYRYGYELRLNSHRAESGYAAVRNTVYFVSALRMRDRP